MGHEDLMLGRYSDRGQQQGSLVNLGPLGLVAQTQILASHNNTLWATTGFDVKQIILGQPVRSIWKAPHGSTILSVDYLQGHLWAVVERIGGHHVDVYAQRAGRFVLVTKCPLAITTLYPAPKGRIAILSVWPHKARGSLWGRHGMITAWTLHQAVQGSMAVGMHYAYLPFAKGMRQFGLATFPLGLAEKRSAHLFRHISQAIIQVIPSYPVYGLTVRGVERISSMSIHWGHVRNWPHPLQSTVTSALGPFGWSMILDGPSQGLWFNVHTHRFGPAFRCVAPPNMFPRAVEPWE